MYCPFKSTLASLLTEHSYCLFLAPTLWTFTVSNDLRACSSALFVMAERTPVVKKYRDALETVIGATMEFLARLPPSNPAPEPNLSSPIMTAKTPQQKHLDLNGSVGVNVPDFSPGFSSAAQESYVRGSARNDVETPAANGGVSAPDYSTFDTVVEAGENDVFSYMPETHNSPGAVGRWEGRHGEMGQMDAEWLLSLCEGDGFSLSMLNEMMRFEPSLGA